MSTPVTARTSLRESERPALCPLCGGRARVDKTTGARCCARCQWSAPTVRVQTTAAQCLRCDHVWHPRVALPSKCPACFSVLWNIPRRHRYDGKPAPTIKAKVRGKPFESGNTAAVGRVVSKAGKKASKKKTKK